MSAWIYLSKHGQDEYINAFARGSGQEPTVLETWQYEQSQAPLVLRGILKHKIIKRCWADQRPFLYMDTGYMGNRANALNPQGWKVWHRIVPDDFQHGDILDRPADRWQQLHIQCQPRRSGSRILIAAPDQKPCDVYGIVLDNWLHDTVNTLRTHTDREIVIRARDKNRQHRAQHDFVQALDDVWAVVTFNSNAAVEAIQAGVPAFVLAPSSAAKPVANVNLADIETPFFPDDDLREQWCRHLAYGQFHNTELANGTARAIISQEWPRCKNT